LRTFDRELLEGTHYPAVSLYTLPEQAAGASLSVNFGARASPAAQTAL